jgi:hypothetical protein
MQFFGASQQAETHAKLLVQALSVIGNHVQTATFSRALWPESADYHLPSGLDRIGHLTHVCNALFWRCQKVEHCTIMLHIVGTGLQLRFGNVGDDTNGCDDRIVLTDYVLDGDFPWQNPLPCQPQR